MITIRTKLAAALAAAVALACSGGSDDPPRVTVTRQITTWNGAGAKATAPDDEVQSIAAIVAGAGGTTRLEGTPTSPGVWRIADVPEGPYLLEVKLATSAAPTWYATSADRVDLGVDRLGEAPVHATASTPVTFELEGLRPVGDADTIQLYSADAGLWQRLSPASLSGGATGGAETFDFFGDDKSIFGTAWTTPLLDATDELWVVQSRSGFDFALPSGYETGVAFGKTRGTATPDGDATTLEVTLEPVTTTGTLTADWKTSAFEALIEGAEQPEHHLYVSAVPVPLGHPTAALSGMSIDLLETWIAPDAITTATGDLAIEALEYGRFLPSTFRELRFASFG
ncbi:MAG TPA: hypothetical protein VD838_15325, partial [Anaeromyxobacteraceae bacterium]|nr:hypothetical protein [Anaeromyxobacteraceae bacterium]